MSHTPEELPLFLPPTEDEERAEKLNKQCVKQGESLLSNGPMLVDDQADEKLISSRSIPVPPSSPRSEVVFHGGEDAGVEPPASSIPSQSSEAHTRKRRRTQETTTIASGRRSEYYLGSILVANAWSTVKGTGYVKPGDLILVERDTLQQEASGDRDGRKKGKGKQVTINSMFKAQAKGGQPKKAKANTIVRLTNARGFEFGRLPTDVSNWVSKLLDLGIITFSGSRMVDCPERLHSGADLLVSLSIYILPSAFQRYSPSGSDPAPPKTMFGEGQETIEEEVLRNRKASLQQLFDKLSLKPRSGNVQTYDKENIPPAGSPQPPGPNGGVKKCLDNVNGNRSDDADEDEGEMLNENDLDVIYKRARIGDADMAEMEACDTFLLKLRPYQKQALLWMYSREIGASTARQSKSMDPLWAEYVFPPEPDNDGMLDLTASDMPFYYNTHSGELSLEFPYANNVCRGGILADEMGMGKTIMVSSLIQTNRGEKLEEEIPIEIEERQRAKDKQLRLDAAFRPTVKKQARRRSRATLIVAPASLLDQWASEIRRSSEKGTVNVMVWHGQNRENLEAMIDSDIDAIDVVVTSYGTLSSEHSRLDKLNKPPPIFDIEWFRVVLDEAHNIKSRASKTARAAFDLKAPRRWALTGTPIVNRLEDLYSLLRFLNFAPWSDYSFFRSVVTLPFLNREPKAIEVVQVILESVLLRREKTMRDRDGNMIVQLPAKEVKHEYLEFGPLERRIYDSLYDSVKRKFDRLNASGLLGRKYTHILAMLMKLRRAVLHPSLVLSEDEDNTSGEASTKSVDIDDVIRQFAANSDADNGAYAQTVLSNLSLKEDEECPICMDVMQDPVLLPACAHKGCKDCFLASLARQAENGEEGSCPICRRGPVKEDQLLEIVKRRKARATSIGIAPEAQESDSDAPSSSPEFELRRNDFKSSTKLNALMQHLRRLRDQDPCFRAIVFSQFTSFLDLIEIVMERESLAWYRLDGSTEIKRRHQIIAEFNAPSRTPKVFMLSLKAGGVGLNLTSANHVFMMDCWWNAAIENQAIDRVHRIGQERTVFVTHFIVSDTIEGRILTIQKRKTAVIKEALKGQSGADSESMENLRIMFGDD